MNLVILQQVNQTAQIGVIASEGAGTGKRGPLALARPTENLALPGQATSSRNAFAANRAQRTFDGLDYSALRANRQARNVGERETAETTIGGEQRREQAFSDPA